jgi:WD40 repeat protein
MCYFRHLSLTFVLLSLLPLPAIGQPSSPAITRLDHKGWRRCVAFSPDGKTLATDSDDDSIRFWDVASGKQRFAIKADGSKTALTRLAYFPDGKTLASGGSAWGGAVKLWDVATGAEKQVVAKNPGGISVVVVSPNGELLAWSGGGKVELYDVKAGRAARAVKGSGAVDSAAFSPDGKLLATAHGGAVVRLWDLATGDMVREVAAGQTTATGSQAVAFSTDSQTMATASGKLRLWKVATGKEIAALGPADELVFCVAFSSDGRYVAAGTSHHALRVWDMKTHQEAYAWKDEPAASVAFSPDSKRLAFGSRAGRGVGLVELKPAK